MMMQRTTTSALALALVAALAGCAAAPSAAPPAAPSAAPAPAQATATGHEAQIRARSTAFWQARQRNDVAAAYSYTSPSYRKVHDQEFFRVHYSGIPVVVSREIVDVQCDAALQRCILQNKYMVSPPMMGGGMVPVYGKEIWLQEDGQWWIFRE